MSKTGMQQALDALKSAEVLLPVHYKSKWIGVEAIAALEVELANPIQDKGFDRTASHIAGGGASKQVMEMLKGKFTSGNGVPVERITVTRAEYEAAIVEPAQDQDINYELLQQVRNGIWQIAHKSETQRVWVGTDWHWQYPHKSIWDTANSLINILDAETSKKSSPP